MQGRSSTNIMVHQSDTLQAFVKLGEFLRCFGISEKKTGDIPEYFKEWDVSLQEAIEKASYSNAWFTIENILFALETWAELLRQENLADWLAPYPLKQNKVKTVALIMAGNIPLVGFHDLLSTLISGNRALIKPSSNDPHLLRFVAAFLQNEYPGLDGYIEFASGPLKGFDAVIATGSDNTARYFDYYFGKVPNLIRRNRNSVAVIRGDESEADLKALGTDIFRYFGLGCRNVSKLYVPEGYSFDRFFESIQEFEGIGMHSKYANNYDYNKAVYLMSDFPFLDNGFLLLKEDQGFGSPIGVLFYQTYNQGSPSRTVPSSDNPGIQCIVGNRRDLGEIPFGNSQYPGLAEYADGVDTLNFLLGS